MINMMLQYAFSQLGTPYIYGANGGGAYDCSGFVLECLESVGLIGSKDRTAQDIYNYFIIKGYHSSNPGRGDLVFYGKSIDNISHVSIVYEISNSVIYIIEAGGGDNYTNTISDSYREGAQVRIRPLASRSDIVAIINPMGK